MTASCARIGDLILQIQEDFIDTPGLRLTAPEAHERFGVDKARCEAVLAVLVDANVLARTREGTYIRHFPRRPFAAHAA